jgi:hypothetical protein
MRRRTTRSRGSSSTTGRRQSDLAKAYEHARRAVELEGEGQYVANYSDTAGWAAHVLGLAQEALDLIGQGAGLDPYDVVVHTHLAEAEAAKDQA